MASGKLKYTCKYPNCTNSYFNGTREGHVNKHFFTFPKNVNLYETWKSACNIEGNAKYFRICEDHFVTKDFLNERKDRLNINVVPIACIQEATASSNIILSETTPFTHLENQIVSDHLVEPDCLSSNNEGLINLNSFNYLKDSGSGILDQTFVSKSNTIDNDMYRIHRNTCSKLCKLRSQLSNLKEKTNMLERLYKTNVFEVIDQNLNSVTKDFINSQLFNINKDATARRWTNEDKAFSLSIYKRSPRLYKYLQAYFLLPSTRTLKSTLAKIPFEPGLNKPILEHLGLEISKINLPDRYCVLLFDEMSLCKGLHYEQHKQQISGFVDLGTLGRSIKEANHALVFMVRGIRKQWKQVVAYYFTANTIASCSLKGLIKETIGALQNIGLIVVGTVCDQGPTNQSAISQLCAEPHPKQCTYCFYVNDQPVVTIFDVPHLLKNTRNALLRCKLQFEPHKFALFEHIESVFNFDQQRRFKSLPKLKKEYFNFSNSYVKMKVKVAASQLSSSVAVAIETFSLLNVLPKDSIFTAEFVEKIDSLFDSLNGTRINALETKPFRCALKADSPHLEFWSKFLTEINQWKLIDLKTNVDVSKQYSFINGWKTTIRSIIFLWHNVKNISGFDYVNLRGLNQDPLENLFSCIRQHGIANINPTCHQFTAALKTIVVNKLTSPVVFNSNCEEDVCTPLENFQNLLHFSVSDDKVTDDASIDFNICKLDDFPSEDCQGLAYVAGYILKAIRVPNCDACHNILFSTDVTNRHLLTYFRDVDSNTGKLKYASDIVMELVQNIHDNLYKYLESYGHQSLLELNFKNLFKQNYSLEQVSCTNHNCGSIILDRCVTFLIHKFVKDKKKASSDKHFKKIKKFKSAA